MKEEYKTKVDVLNLLSFIEGKAQRDVFKKTMLLWTTLRNKPIHEIKVLKYVSLL